MWVGLAPPLIPAPETPQTFSRGPCDHRSPHQEPTRAPVKKLACVSCLFNPLGDPRLTDNARQFRGKISEPVIFVELSFNGKFLFSDSIQVNAGAESKYIWQKERLLNIAIASLPDDVDAVAIIDSDLLFENPNWYIETKRKLETADVVQMFENVKYLTTAGNVETKVTGFVNSSKSQHGLPGGAIAFRKSLSGPNGIYERSILGGGDGVMMRAWANQGLRIVSTSGDVRHLYHGDYKNRQAIKRYDILKAHNFDFERDIESTPGGPLSWMPGSREMKGAAAKFFGERAGMSLEENSLYDIDVFIPYHRNLHLVTQTVDSILWQAGVKPFIHLVNDCSREDDAPLKERYGHLGNVAWYKTKSNCGPYAIANSLFHHMKTDVIGIADSDDIYMPHHFRTAIDELNSTGSHVWCSSMMQFLNPLQEHHERNVNNVKKNPLIKSGILMKSCRSPRVINATMVIRKSMFESLNGFDGLFFCGADTEFTQRLQVPSRSNPKIHFNKTVTSMRRICTNSLSNSQDRFGYQSGERKKILDATNERFDEWERLGEIDPTKYGNLKQQADVLEKLVVINKRKSKVYACMTTIPRRIYALEKAVDSLLPQVDQLYIHLNDFHYVPDFLKDPRIQLVFGTNELMSCPKFLWADKLNGYVLTCDDDFIFPPDYVAKMIEGIDRHKCWICAHGSKLDEQPIENYYRNRTVYDGKGEVKQDIYVDVPGTGLSGFHTDDIRISMDDINLPGMEDIAAYIHTYNHSYKVVVIAHPDKWLVASTHGNDKGLWGESRFDGRKETVAINTRELCDVPN
ncbi:glycosyltransferase [uncultured Gimesia sp.]|uniref:glycosyltransferase n=1 Tax=uncultured Gimesia sp. TaxID=1678688 RepID=UPI0030DA70D3